MGVAFNVRAVDFREYFFHGFDSLFKGLVEPRAVKNEILHFSPFLVDGGVLLDGGDSFGEAASADKEFSVELTVGPIFCEEFRRVEAVAISREHKRTGPEATNAIKLFTHNPTGRVLCVFVGLG